MSERGQYGWDKAGNCLWCGESGRCTCSHGREVKETALRLAAAPELLEALKRLTDSIQYDVGHLDDYTEDFLSALNAAHDTIAKATGQE